MNSIFQHWWFMEWVLCCRCSIPNREVLYLLFLFWVNAHNRQNTHFRTLPIFKHKCETIIIKFSAIWLLFLTTHNMLRKKGNPNFGAQVCASLRKSVQVCICLCKSVQVCTNLWKSVQVSTSLCKFVQNCTCMCKYAKVWASLQKSVQVCTTLSGSLEVEVCTNLWKSVQVSTSLCKFVQVCTTLSGSLEVCASLHKSV